MPLLGERSKFACLKIDDDTSSSNDDEQNGPKLMGKATSSKTKSYGSKKKPIGDVGFIVHPVPQKQKSKGKKAKKIPVVEEDGFIVQDEDGDYMEKKYREDLQQAIEISREMATTACADFVQESASSDTHAEPRIEQEAVRTKDVVDLLISEIDSEAAVLFTKSNGPQKDKEQLLVALYRSKLMETLRQVALEEEKKMKAESEVSKYKSRYKKLCELLKDAEVNEKAHMAADLEKARTVEEELSGQIGELRGELMQARSKIRELEIKYKELLSKQQH